MTGIHAAVGGISLPCPPDPFEPTGETLCAVCGEYKHDVEDYNVCGYTIPMCAECLEGGEEAAQEAEEDADSHDLLLADLTDFLNSIDSLTEDERDEVFARAVDALPAKQRAEVLAQ